VNVKVSTERSVETAMMGGDKSRMRPGYGDIEKGTKVLVA